MNVNNNKNENTVPLSRSEIELITKYHPKDWEREERFYRDMICRLGEKDDLKEYFEDIGYDLRYGEYGYDDDEGMWNNPTIILTLKKTMDKNDFTIYREFLIGLLNRREPQWNWELCWSNQHSNSFSNCFEIHPKVKEEYSLDTLYHDKVSERVSVFKEINDLQEKHEYIDGVVQHYKKQFDEYEVRFREFELKEMNETNESSI